MLADQHNCTRPRLRDAIVETKPAPSEANVAPGLLSTSPNPANTYAANTNAANAYATNTRAANANPSVPVATHAANANANPSVAVAAPTQTSAVIGSAVGAWCVAVATRCGVTVAAGAPAPAPTERRSRSAFKGKERCCHRQGDDECPHAHLITPIRHSPL